MKDFTTVFELPTDARAEIISTLRDAYDGEASKAFGTGEVKKFRSRFGILAAVTPYVERCWGVNQQLGERFLKFRLRGEKRTTKVRRAIGNANGETAMRVSLSEAALGVLAQDNGIPTMPEHIERQLVHLADFVSRVRSEVSRDRRGVVEFVHQPEIGTRVGKQLKKLAIGIAMARSVRAVDDDVYRIIRRVGMDSVPSIRMKLLRVLWAFRDDFRATSNIGDEAEVPTETAKTWLEDLRLLGIVERHGKGKFLWRLLDDFIGTVTACGVFDANDVDCVYTPPSDSYPPQTDDGPADFEGGKNHPSTYAQDRREPENPLLDTENDDSVGSEHSDQEPDISDEAEWQAIQETEAEEARRAAGVPDGWSAETCRLACAAEAVGVPGTT